MKLSTRWLFPLALGLVVSIPSALAAAPAKSGGAVIHPTPEEVVSLSSAGELAISPDGSRLLYALSTNHLDPAAKPAEQDKDAGWQRDRQLWWVNLAGGEPRQLTSGAEKAGSPQWSPDGREIAFLRKVKDKTLLQVIAVDGGEAVAIPTGELEPTHVRWSPDGKSFAFLAPIPESKDAKDEKWRTGGVVDWGDQWRDDVLWVVGRAGGEPRRVTAADENVADFQWSPDGAKFVILTSRNADPYEVSCQLTPKLVSVRDGALIRSLGGAGTYDAPTWSPDGKRVAVLTTQQSLSMMNVLLVSDAGTGKSANVVPNLELSMTGFVWSPDSKSLIALALQRTGTALLRFPVEGGEAVDLGFSGRVAEPPLTIDRAGKKLAFISSTDREARDPTVFDLDTRQTQIPTHLNPQVAQWSLGREEVVRWKSENGAEIEGLLLVSPQAHAGAPAPLFVYPHGGPDAATPQSFSGFIQFFAAHGYSVFMPNYRGSLAYGHDFYAANRGRLGEIEFRDIESGVDALIASGKADAKKLVYGGWSWGGFLTAWAIGHTTRYRAAVVGAGVSDVSVQYSLSDINHGVASAWEFLGNPWKQTENFDRSNPIRSIKNASTPTLILHGQEDPRVGFTSSVELYRALSDLGVPVRFYAYPREPHGLMEPAHQAHRLQVWLDWFQHYLTSTRS